MTRLPDMLREIVRAGEGSAEGWSALANLARHMEEDGRQRDDPMRDVLALLGDRWTMLILLTLATGAWRHATLRRIIGVLAVEGAISQRILTLKLRALERNGFVDRETSDDVPPRVSYSLSLTGRSLVDEAGRLLAWVRDQRSEIENARRRFDAVESP